MLNKIIDGLNEFIDAIKSINHFRLNIMTIIALAFILYMSFSKLMPMYEDANKANIQVATLAKETNDISILKKMFLAEIDKQDSYYKNLYYGRKALGSGLIAAILILSYNTCCFYKRKPNHAIKADEK